MRPARHTHKVSCCFGMLALLMLVNCALPDDPQKNRCSHQADCVAGYTCEHSYCLPQERDREADGFMEIEAPDAGSEVPLDSDSSLQPTVRINQPQENDTVTGSVSIHAAIFDPESRLSLVQIDIGCANTSMLLLAYKDKNYTVSWNTNQCDDGTATLKATGMDEQSQPITEAHSVEVTIANGVDCPRKNFTGGSASIPDNDPNGVTSTLQVAESGKLNYLAVSLNVVNTYGTDLVIDLISPTGTKVNLHNRQEIPSGSLFINDFPIGGFNNEQTQGAWELFLKDLSAGDPMGGLLINWTITLGICQSG